MKNLKKIVGLIMVGVLALGFIGQAFGSGKKDKLVAAMNEYISSGNTSNLEQLIKKDSSLASNGLQAAVNKYNKLITNSKIENVDTSNLAKYKRLIIFFKDKGGKVTAEIAKSQAGTDLNLKEAGFFSYLGF
jgi:hypothetical protein